MIRQPEEMTFTDKKFSMIIYGSPGLGKTTLACRRPPRLSSILTGVYPV